MQFYKTSGKTIGSSNFVYLLQDIPIDRETGQPKYNIMGARKYGEIKIMFRALEQIMFSPGPYIFN